jgi:sulfate permease, SulP family
MKTLRRALVAVSLTEADHGLLRYAALVAGLGDSQYVDFVHVLPEMRVPPDEAELEQTRLRLEAEVAEHFGRPREGLVVSCHAVQAARIDALLNFAVKHGCDVILLGHRKSHNGRRSMARRLAAIAPCSVWLVPEGAPVQINSILAPIDFSEHAADSLSVSTAIARWRGLEEIHALHVFFDPSTIRYDEHLEEIQGNEQRAFAQFLERVDCHGVRVEPLFEESTHVPDAILRVAQRHSADLIVMNTRGRSRAAAILLGSMTSDTMANSHIPVLAVKHFGAALHLFQVLVNKHFWSTPEPKTN